MERSIQHSRDNLNKKDDSHQFKHYTEAHADLDMKEVKFGVTVLRQFFSSFVQLSVDNILRLCWFSNMAINWTRRICTIGRRFLVYVMFSELEENKKVYDEDELEAEVMKLKQSHIREPGMEDPPPPPCKKQKRLHNSRKKKRKLNEAFWERV